MPETQTHNSQPYKPEKPCKVNASELRIEAKPKRYGFPPGFLWGASTSAYQIEGGWNEGAKGLQIWDVFSQAPGNMANGDDGNIACDHYHRYEEDVALMKALGLQAYRFSISWSRVMPEGRGRVSQEGLDFYRRLIDKLNEAGIKPFVTLYHWDLPLGLHEIGGWLNRDLSHYFAEYAALIGREFGDKVASIATFNEPEVILAGYLGRGMAPGYASPRMKAQVGHNLLLAHGRAVQALRTVAPYTPVGIVLNFNQIDPADRRRATVQAARQFWTAQYGWYLDGLLNGLYPMVIQEHVREGTLHIRPEDMKLISQKIDFLGVNFYTRFIIDAHGQHVEPQSGEKTLMGWEISPQSFTRMLLRMKSEWPGMPPIFITENGVALRDHVEEGSIRDPGRIQYIHEHLKALSRSIKSGVDVRGYFVWSLMDNLEWPLGFDMTFGIIHVHSRTKARTIKDSGHWYSATIRKNSEG